MTRPKFLLQLDTIFQHLSLLQISTSILCNMQSYALVSSQIVGKCQILTYIENVGDMLGCQTVALPRTKQIVP